MLIDLENASPTYMDQVMSRARQYGEVTRRLAFGPNTEGKWTNARVAHAIRWASQSQVKTGKNSADIELTITAMELLHDRNVTGFCIVSSDSDFTPLVMKLREAGKLVIGFGEEKAPAAFVKACDQFETIGPTAGGQAASAKRARQGAGKSKSASSAPEPTGSQGPNGRATGDKTRGEFLELVKRAAKDAKNHDGWIFTAVVGSHVRKLKPDIQYKDYGHKTLIGILETYPDAIETRGVKNRKQIRLKS